MHSPRSPIYGETLARRGLAPLDFLKCYRMCEQEDHTYEISLPHLSTSVMGT
jgi:hypothetical protein